MPGTKKHPTSIRVTGKGHEILALLNQDYESFIHEFAQELMNHPNGKYTLFLRKAYT